MWSSTRGAGSSASSTGSSSSSASGANTGLNSGIQLNCQSKKLFRNLNSKRLFGYYAKRNRDGNPERCVYQYVNTNPYKNISDINEISYLENQKKNGRLDQLTVQRYYVVNSPGIVLIYNDIGVGNWKYYNENDPYNPIYHKSYEEVEEGIRAGQLKAFPSQRYELEGRIFKFGYIPEINNFCFYDQYNINDKSSHIQQDVFADFILSGEAKEILTTDIEKPKLFSIDNIIDVTGLENVNTEQLQGDMLLNGIIVSFPGVDFTDYEEHLSLEYDITKIIEEIGIPAQILMPELSDQDKIYITEIYEVYNFLRCYIDMLHDFLSYGIEIGDYICRNYLEYWKSKGEQPQGRQDIINILNHWITKVRATVITTGNNISQIRCRLLLEEIIDEYINKLHEKGIIKIPKLKPQAFRGSSVVPSSKDNPAESEEINDNFTNFCSTLRNSFRAFFVESMASSIGPNLKRLEFYNTNFTVGDWDAGSGYKGEAIDITIGSEINDNKATNNFNLANPEAIIYGLYKVEVHESNNALLIYNINTNEGFIVFPRIKLSLNLMAQTMFNQKIRGSSEVSDTSDGSAPVLKLIAPNVESGITFVNNNNERNAMLAALKTWTDLIQIKAVEASKENRLPQIATIISDGLCETTARMHGLSHVLRNEGRNVIHYSYDINANELTEDQIKKRYRVRQFILEKNDFINYYVDTYFKTRLSKMNEIINTTEDPSLYFISNIYLEIIQNNYEKAGAIISNIVESINNLKQLPESINEFMESLTQGIATTDAFVNDVESFRKSMDLFNSLGIRIIESTIEDYFINGYEAIKQKIVDTLKNVTPDQLDIYIATTIAYLILLKRGRGDPISTLNSVRTKVQGNSTMVNDLNRIEYVYSIIFDNILGYQEYIQNIKLGNKAVPVNHKFSFKNILNFLQSQPQGGGRRSPFHDKTRRTVRRQIMRLTHKKRGKKHGNTRRLRHKFKKRTRRK